MEAKILKLIDEAISYQQGFSGHCNGADRNASALRTVVIEILKDFKDNLGMKHCDVCHRLLSVKTGERICLACALRSVRRMDHRLRNIEAIVELNENVLIKKYRHLLVNLNKLVLFNIKKIKIARTIYKSWGNTEFCCPSCHFPPAMATDSGSLDRCDCL